MSCWRSRDLVENQQSKDIDKDIKDERKKEHLKLLLLGTGDAGKSTFAKQMILSFQCGGQNFPVHFADNYVAALRDNCLSGMVSLIHSHQQSAATLPPKAKELTTKILETAKSQSGLLTPELANIITTLWNIPEARQELFEKANESEIPGGLLNCQYYITNAERFASPTFLPTTKDILCAKLKTTGILETQFNYDGRSFTLVDVGGQRSERKKWLHCFNDVTAVIFLTAISDYNLYLEEDGQTNRLVESIKLWKSLCLSQYLKGIPFILFLNKTDLFVDKIKKCPLHDIFSDYEAFSKTCPSGMSSYEIGWRYFLKQFSTHFVGNNFYSHLTCAMDTDQCKKVFLDIQRATIRGIVSRTGFM